jgi:hypothetical protein
MTAPVAIGRALGDARLLGAAIGDLSSWATWLAVLKAAFGHPLDDRERALFDAVAGGREPPRRKVKELVAVASRRSGKGRVGAALAVHAATMVGHRLAPGETGVVACISPTRAQASVVMGYCRGFLESSAVLRREVASVADGEIVLGNGNVITTLAADYRSLRGRTLVCALLDEAAFLRSETSSTPDIETARAVLPGLSTTGGMLVILSSPYRRAGLLFERHRAYFGKDDDDVLVVAGASELFNPTLDREVIARAREADPAAARAEWDGLFRDDISSFLSDDLIEAAVVRGRPLELPPREGVKYHGFVDASAGRHDAFTICIMHREGERVVADVVRGRKPPFNPSEVAAEFAALALDYRVGEVVGDNFAAEWVATAFRAAGCRYARSPLTRSELYLEGLPSFVRELVQIPEHPVLIRELRLLERRTSRAGKDVVDHGAGGSDDYANVVFGAVRLATRPPAVMVAPIIITQPRPDLFGVVPAGEAYNPVDGIPYGPDAMMPYERWGS